MKHLAKTITLRAFFLICLANFFTLVVSAQDSSGGGSTTTTTSTKTTDVNITSGPNNEWYTQPWVWIIGAAIFILLLVALLSGNKGRDTVTSSDRVTVKKTVERDVDPDVS